MLTHFLIRMQPNLYVWPFNMSWFYHRLCRVLITVSNSSNYRASGHGKDEDHQLQKKSTYYCRDWHSWQMQQFRKNMKKVALSIDVGMKGCCQYCLIGDTFVACLYWGWSRASSALRTDLHQLANCCWRLMHSTGPPEKHTILTWFCK